MGSELLRELPNTAVSIDVPPSTMSKPNDQYAEAKKAFAELGQGNTNAQAPSTLPDFGLTNGGKAVTGDSNQTFRSLGEQTPLEKQGWSQGSGGGYSKTEPLPKNWDSMTPAEKQQYLGEFVRKADQELGISPGGPIMGRSEDPRTGDRIWMGWAGQAPSKEDQEWLKGGSQSGV
jgi:hypothetical protein